MKDDLKNKNNRENSNDEIRVKGILSKGYGISPKLVMQDREITIEAKGIYSYFASYAGNGTTAFPSVNKIIYDLSIGEERFYNHRKYLIDKGYITIEKKMTDNGKFSRNIYTLPPYPEIRSTDNRWTGNRSTDNRGTNSNSINNNNINNNSINKAEDDDDLNIQIKKVITSKIIKKLKKAGIENLTITKLRPIAISISKLMNLYNRNHEEAEEVILLAIEFFELNNGRSLNYIIALLEDWEEKELYSAEEIRKYRSDYKRGYTYETESDIEPVPMINWLKDLQK